jgi:hypothetical protein
MSEISGIPTVNGSGAAGNSGAGTQTFDDAVRAQSATATDIPEEKLVALGAGISASLILPLIFNTIKYAKEATEGFDE